MTETLERDVRDRGSVPHLSRTTTILRVAAAMGWSHLAEKMGLSRFIPQVGDSSAGKDQTEAVRLRLALEQLGPTFVKLGQLLSVQRDLLPAEVIAELEKLQEKAAPFSFAEVKRIVQAELGQPIDRLFSRFEETPMAAASMAQVHHADLHDGTNAVVKVQRPGIEEVIRADLEVMSYFARLLERHVPGSRLYNPQGVVQELEQTILRELDFLLDQSYRSVSALKSAFGELPVALAKGMKQLHQGELTLRVRHDGLEAFQQHLDRASNRVSLSLLIAAIVVASSIVMSFHTGPHFEGIPLIGLIGYGLAAVLGLGWAIAILRSGKL